MPIPIQAIRDAAVRLAPHLHRTPVLSSRTLGEQAGVSLVLKAESLQKTAADIRAFGRQAFTIETDVGDMGQCQAACEKALASPSSQTLAQARVIDNAGQGMGERRHVTRLHE